MRLAELILLKLPSSPILIAVPFSSMKTRIRESMKENSENLRKTFLQPSSLTRLLKITEVIGIERGEVIRRKNVHVYIPNNFDYLDPSQFVPSVAPEEQEDTEIETT